MAVDSYGVEIAVREEVKYTAKGHGYYRVLVEGEEVSKHSAEREALESAANRYEEGLDVRVIHDYEVQVVKNYRGKIVKVRVKTHKLKLNTPMAIVSYTAPGLGQTNPDTVPDAFTFASQTNVAISTTVTSEYNTLSGTTLPTSISISGANNPEYQIETDPWTNVAGTISPGVRYRVRHESSAFPGLDIETFLTIGGVVGSFVSTTEGAGGYVFTHYASPTGVATYANATNISTPCSIQTAFANATAGDVVGIRGGTYELGPHTNSTYQGILIPANSGTAANPIVFAAYTGETPVLNADSAGSTAWGTNGNVGATILGAEFRSYITYDGLKLTCDGGGNSGKAARIALSSEEAGSYPFTNWSTHHIIVNNCEVDGGNHVHTAAPNDNASLIRINKSRDCTISNCYLYNLQASNGYQDFSGIKAYNGVRITVENNQIENTRVGIRLKSGNTDWIIRNNFLLAGTVHEMSIGIFFTTNLSPAKGNQVYNNLLVGIGDSGESAGMFMWDEEAQLGNQNNHVYNNTVYAPTAPYGCYTIHNQSLSEEADSLESYNNIFYGNGSARSGANAVYGWNGLQSPRYDVIDYNLYNGPSGFAVWAIGTNYTSLATLQAATVGHIASPGHDQNSVDQAPVFLNGSGTLREIADFELSAGSPGKNAGNDGNDMGCNIATVGIGNG